MRPTFSTRLLTTVLIAATALLLCECSKNNLGDLFKPRSYVQGDPADAGFGDPDANGAYSLYGLEAGTIYGEGGPTVETVYPADGSSSVDVTAFVILFFSESIGTSEAALGTAVTVKEAGGSGSVAGDVFFVDGTARRCVAFDPSAALADDTEYEVEIAATLIDAQGENYMPSGAVSTFTTGKAGDNVLFEIIESLTFPAPGSTGVTDRAQVLLFFSEGVDTTSVAGAFNIEDQSSVDVAGTLSYPADFVDRLVVFTPDADMPSGKRIDVTLARSVFNADRSEQLDAQYDFSFTVIGIPHVTAIEFDAGDPLVALPASIYAGRVTLANRDAVKTTLTLTGSGRSDRLVLIFWDNASKAIVIVDEASRQAGTVSYTVDLKPMHAGGSALSDGTISVGAYTSDSGGNSPVGPPLVLPDLLKDIVDPGLYSLGPPTGAASAGQLLLEVPSAGVHGRADEALSAVKVTVDVDGTPQELDGIVFFSMEYPDSSGIYSQEVTRGGGNLFITESLTGVDVDLVGRAGPFPVTEIEMTDLVGNTTVLTTPTDTSVGYRGYVDQLATATNELEVFCYDAVTLRPIANADVLVDQHSTSYGGHSADRLGGQTDSDGRITFVNVSQTLPESMFTVTAIRDGYDFTSLLGLAKPATGSGVSISLPLAPEGDGDESEVDTYFSDAAGIGLPEVYVGGNRLLTGSDEVLHSAGNDPEDDTITAARGRLQFFQAMGVQTSTPEDLYQWTWSNPFIGETGSSILVMLFTDLLQTTAQLTVQDLETENLLSTYTEFEARLRVRLDGFTGTLPVAVDREGLSIGSTDELSFVVPLPPSLLVNEVIASGITTSTAFDPPYEVVLEPALGPASYTADPDQAILEAALLFEVEQREAAADSKIIRKRIPYTQAGIGTARNVTFPLQGGATIEMGVAILPTSDHPLQATLVSPLALAGTQGAFKIEYAPDGGIPQWTVLAPSSAITQQNQVVHFPDLSAANLPTGFVAANDFTPFLSTGKYGLRVEAFDIPGFDLNEAFFSTIDRDWETFWRSNLAEWTF